MMYNYDESYYKTIENHVVNIINIHEQALAKNIQYTAKLKKIFIQKKDNIKNALNYELGNVVWVDVRQQSKAKKSGKIKWIGPYTICKVDEGLMYYIEYKTEGLFIKFQKVYS